MLRFILPMSIALALDLYGYFVLKSFFADKSMFWRQTFATLWWSIPVLLLVNICLSVSGINAKLPKGVQPLIASIFFILYFAKLVASVGFLIDDFRRGVTGIFHYLNRASSTVFMPDRSRFLTQMAVLAGSLPVVTLGYGMIRNPHRYEVRTVDIPIRGLAPKLEGLKIVQISDIHSGSFYRRSPLKEGIRMINDLKPDLVCFTGDLVNAKATEIEPYLDIFSNIQSVYGTYSIIGNHDYGDYVSGWGEQEKAANWQRLYLNHQRLGWQLLMNENRILDIDGEPLALIGVENWSALDRFPRTGDLSKALLGTEQVATKILLSHDPTHWDAQVAPHQPDIALQLAGHTHGFQFGVEIPGFRWSPSQYVYEQWAGLYTRGHQHLYINRGFGYLGYPGRVGILPEISLLRLVAV